MVSLMLHDWRLMGKTSLLMFPIYGMGALLAPIGRLVDRWLNVEKVQVSGAAVQLQERDRIMRYLSSS